MKMVKNKKNIKKVTFKDFDVRYENLKKENPSLPNCSFEGCKNPVDITAMGMDSSCAYHRLLHDEFLYNGGGQEIHPMAPKGLSREEYRKKFKEWADKLGKKKCDAIVLKMAQEPLNWAC